MKRQYWLVLLGVMFLSNLFAADNKAESKKTTLKPALILNHLKPVKLNEKSGDELYMDIGVYRAQKQGRFYRIPKFPKNWPSSHLDKIKKITLWSEPVKAGERVILIVSLLEQDITPMNPDDLIGSMRVDMKNEDGVLSVQWSIPNRSTGPVTILGEHGNIERFELLSDKGEYEAYLSLKSHLTTPKKEVKKHH